MATTFHIGTSGWHYPHWRGRFYPEALPPRDWLTYYARRFDSVEINSSFYRLPSLSTARHWRDSVPENFRFALKASRFITHRKKLQAPRASLRSLLTVARALGSRCGPILFQLPPRWRSNPARLATFLHALPAGRDYACFPWDGQRSFFRRLQSRFGQFQVVLGGRARKRLLRPEGKCDHELHRRKQFVEQPDERRENSFRAKPVRPVQQHEPQNL